MLSRQSVQAVKTWTTRNHRRQRWNQKGPNLTNESRTECSDSVWWQVYMVLCTTPLLSIISYIYYMCVCIYLYKHYPSLEHHFPKMSSTKLQREELNFSWMRDERHWFLYSRERQWDRQVWLFYRATEKTQHVTNHIAQRWSHQQIRIFYAETKQRKHFWPLT